MKYFLSLFTLFITLSCTSPEPKELTGDEPVAFSDFTGLFPELKLPFTVADTGLVRKIVDSLAIKPKLFTQFVADSMQRKIFGKTKPKIFPMGRVKGDVTYLLIKTVAGEKKASYALAFDKDDKLLTYLPLMLVDNAAATSQQTVMDSRYAFYVNVQRRNADGSVSEGKDVFDLDPETGTFHLVMTDPLDDVKAELVNPIDTFARKNKFSADYGTGKNNIISFRDGRKADRLLFFLHFEKADDCTGELKGEAILRSGSLAEYREPGDPCSIQFNFSSTAVTIREIDGCGAHRGLRCSFNGVYSKKKIAKPKAKKK